jgi:hypothetical protein
LAPASVMIESNLQANVTGPISARIYSRMRNACTGTPAVRPIAVA